MLTMQLAVRPETGALLRVLGVVERRCFSIEKVEASLDRQRDVLHIQLVVSGDRPPSKLTTQLEKLYVVKKLEVLQG